jgi:hypothetical protein
VRQESYSWVSFPSQCCRIARPGMTECVWTGVAQRPEAGATAPGRGARFRHRGGWRGEFGGRARARCGRDSRAGTRSSRRAPCRRPSWGRWSVSRVVPGECAPLDGRGARASSLSRSARCGRCTCWGRWVHDLPVPTAWSCGEISFCSTLLVEIFIRTMRPTPHAREGGFWRGEGVHRLGHAREFPFAALCSSKIFCAVVPAVLGPVCVFSARRG